ncbi:glycosyltransferase [Leucobacter soli]|uniref:glycosyltransferase n=1 Tax=Leucobacter soli TaxID=2812850 RepID=UPI003621BD48
MREARIAHPDATVETTRPAVQQSLPRRVYDVLELRAPWLIDVLREAVTRRRARRIARPLPRARFGSADAATGTVPAPAAPAADGPPAILFGLHWLQPSGAERWAVETIGIARRLGFLPIVVTDHDSVHPWLTRPELADALVLALTQEPVRPVAGDADLLEALLRRYDVRGAVIHHSDWLYAALPALKRLRPELPVVDSLHVIEYLGGGFAGRAVEYDDGIDHHHVISPQLVDWLRDVQGSTPRRSGSHRWPGSRPARSGVRRTGCRPGGTAPGSRRRAVHDRLRRTALAAEAPRPLPPARAPSAAAGADYRAILHGGGESRPLVDALIRRYGLEKRVELRDESTPVGQTYADSDLLVIPSLNEGLTLTTFEAIAAGIPVLSADVGSQRTIVEGEMLVPWRARGFLRAAIPLIADFASGGAAGEARRERAWRAQRDRTRAFAALPDAHHHFEGLLSTWRR